MTKFKFRNKFTSLALASSVCFASLPTTEASAGMDPFVGEIMAVGFNFCPRGWAKAEGQLLSISSHSALFSLLGTMYGGDGRTTFGLPDLRGRSIISAGNGPGLGNFSQGAKGGANTHTLTTSEMPSHSHTVNATKEIGDKGGPKDKILAANEVKPYSEAPVDRQMRSDMISHTGGSQAFNIRDPYQVLQYCIALQGVYPSRD